jgi:hypothetical protein
VLQQRSKHELRSPLNYPNPMNIPVSRYLRHLQRAGTVILLLLMLTGIHSSAQVQLAFTGNPTVSGIFGTLNSTYTYNNIGTTGSITVKAVVKITAISGGASMYSVDVPTGGSDFAWQPVINGPLTANGGCWGMTFTIGFFDASNNFPLTLSSFKANGIDIDGDAGNLREYNEPYNMTSYTVENPTDLTVTSTTNGGVNFRSPKTGYNGISLTQTNVAASWFYNNTQTMIIKMGACCSGGACSATGATSRQYSINFFDAVAYNAGTTILPVDFVKVFGQSVGKKNRIIWQVSQESGLRDYVVQKNNSGSGDFNDIGRRQVSIDDGVAIKQYEYTDDQPGGAAYYRIKGVDRDGRSKYSSTIRMSAAGTDENNLTVFNRSGNALDFTLSCNESQKMILRVADQNGRIVYNSVIGVQKGLNRYSLDKLSLRSKGIYILHLTGSNGINYSSKFVQ